MQPMTDRRLRLIHSNTVSDRAKNERAAWGFENAQQLGLFDDFCKLRIILVPVAEVTSHKFLRALEERNPELVLDTRAFPDFFSVFVSTSKALDEFKRRGIRYDRVPVQTAVDPEEAWKQLSELKMHLKIYLERPTNAPIFLLASTKRNLSQLSDRLRGYISQEVAEANFEEISE